MRIFLILFCFLFCVGCIEKEKQTNNKENVELLYVVDGDTVKIMYNNQKISVRLVGIDCFETSRNVRGKWQSDFYNINLNQVVKRGKESKEILNNFLNGHRYIQLDHQGYDKYNRILGIIYLYDTNINQYMLDKGKCDIYRPRK